MDGIDDEEWMRPYSEKKRCQAKPPAKRTRGTSPLRENIIKENKKRLRAMENSAEAADLRGSRIEASNSESEDDMKEMKEREKLEKLDKMLDDHFHVLESGCSAPPDSSLVWGEKVFGPQKKFPEFVVSSDDMDTVSRALLMNVSSDNSFTLEGMVLRGLIPHRITLEGRCGAITSQWMFHQLTYSANRDLREATCKLFCRLLRRYHDSKRPYKSEWHLSYEDIMTALENFGYTPSRENGGCDRSTGENSPGSGKADDGNAPVGGRSSREDPPEAAAGSPRHEKTAPEGIPDESNPGGDGSVERSAGPMQRISSPERMDIASRTRTRLEMNANGPPSNFRSFLRFLIAYFRAEKLQDTFQTLEAENFVVTLFRVGLDRRTTGVADLLQSCTEALVSCFADAEWPSICERIALALSRVGSTLQNNIQVAKVIPGEILRFCDLQRRVVLLLLSSLVNSQTDLSSPTDVISLFKSIDTKDKTCDFFQLYNMLVLADIYLWSWDIFKQGLGTDHGVWMKLLNNCGNLSVYARPELITVRHWARLKGKNYREEAESYQESLAGSKDQNNQVEDDSEIDDL